MILRGFADLPHGQIHYRSAGRGAKLLALHGSPGSSKQLVKLIKDLSASRQVIAPDTPGNGDSEKLPIAAPLIGDLAAVLPSFLDSLEHFRPDWNRWAQAGRREADKNARSNKKLERADACGRISSQAEPALGVGQVDLYGSHTGAAIAAELAILVPSRVRRVVLDGIQLLTPEARAETMARYALPFSADLDGAYLMRAFQFCRDQYVFYPWYDRTRQGRRSGGLPHPNDLHDWLLEVLKANETYHLNYRAAFLWEPSQRLPLLTLPTLVIAAENDPLAEDTRQAAQMLPNGRFVALPRSDAIDFAAHRLAAIEEFLAAP